MVLGLVLCAPALPAQADPGVPQRPDGPVLPIEPSDNGGDNGWGNCGHNSSGGHPPENGDDRKGNGGYKKGDCCGADTEDPADPSDPTEPGGPTDPGDPTEPGLN